MKKKLLALLLAGAMVMGLSVTAMAATDTFDSRNSGPQPPYESSKPVEIVVTDPSPETVYYVTVDWESLSFEFSFGDSAKWNPERHEYVDVAGAGWVDNRTSAKVTVTNHSNAGVSVQAALDVTEKNDVKATLTNPEFDLETGVGLTFTNADKDFVTLNVALKEGVDVPSATDDFTFGNLTLTISATP